MPASGEENEFVSHVLDLMQSLGQVRARRMFGGYGIFLDRLMFALIADETLYLKADQKSANAFKARGLEAFSYYKKGRKYSMSYFQAPEQTLEHPEAMSDWANMAYAAATRSASEKNKN
ncbi:MAG: TfoX/Sxy family protein [Gammaproteobacteria bacterium]